jgi:hypothetical protein
MLSPKVVAGVSAVLGDRNMGVVTQYNEIRKILMDANIAYRIPLHTDMFVVHPANRGKLGVNAHEAHRNGATIKRVGADLELLKKTTAFELPTSGERRDFILNNFDKIVKRSKGLLANRTGAERYASVGGGHTSQFCRAANAACITKQASISTASGIISKEKLMHNDTIFRVMLEEGWMWDIFPSCVEEKWPQLPDLAQRALNACNNAVTESSELETASTIAEFNTLQDDGMDDWSVCVEAAKASMPPCHAYIEVVGAYVRQYGGGQGAPLIKCLDDFAK